MVVSKEQYINLLNTNMLLKNAKLSEEDNRAFLQQRNLHDFMRRLLVKRFESSFGAFQKVSNVLKPIEWFCLYRKIWQVCSGQESY